MRLKPFSRDFLDSLWKETSVRYSNEDFVKSYDLEVIESSYLIEDIDRAFQVWETAPWYKEVSFEMFCRYILPYRVSDEQLVEHWRDSLIQDYAGCIRGVTDMKQAFALLARAVDKELRSASSKCPYLLDVLTMRDARFSRCEQRCIVTGNVMRALGIPIAYDCVERWANYSKNGHSWIVLMGTDGKTYTLYEGDSIPRPATWIDSSFFKPLALPDSNYSYRVDSLKRAAKVYRQNYFREEDRDYSVMDVSAEYGLTDSVVIQVNSTAEYAELCTFKTGEDWETIVRSKIRKGNCVFRNLGASIVYLPVVVKKDKTEVLDAPFILREGGAVKKLIPSKQKRTMRLNRKYILLTNWTNRWYELIGGHFEASNDSDFRNADLLHTICDFPVYCNEVKLQTTKSYRYVRYVSSKVSKSALAELTFFCNEKEIKGRAMGEGLSPPSQKRAFDHDLMSIADPQQKDYWVGLDLEQPCRLDKLVYYPRNDDNFIVTGEVYELFYCDKGDWHSLGIMTAESGELVYENVPGNALYLLKNRTKGKEERIFTYENDRQVWW
ncbi:hypothetical protein [Bacteroides cellulosilyticus]|uniref:hypothetical protein n=1 Tax=Bacteroides cellulosilyticus TaxID=246787 RepID=UPI001C10E9F4|nr:hypothetical protein [Bacteroides cellulosilyticus]MBU5375769.1 hypothetical protein [Bacteroides cellulosilyticus]